MKKHGQIQPIVWQYIEDTQRDTNPVWLSSTVIANGLQAQGSKITAGQVNDALSALLRKGMVMKVTMADGRQTWAAAPDEGGIVIMTPPENAEMPVLWLNAEDRETEFGYTCTLREFVSKSNARDWSWQELLDPVRWEIDAILSSPDGSMAEIDPGLRLSVWFRWFLEHKNISAPEVDSNRYLLWVAHKCVRETEDYEDWYINSRVAAGHAYMVQVGIDNNTYRQVKPGEKVTLPPAPQAPKEWDGKLDEMDFEEMDELDELIDSVTDTEFCGRAVGPVKPYEPTPESDQKWARERKAATMAEVERMQAQYASGRKAPEARKHFLRGIDADDVLNRYEDRCRKMDDEDRFRDLEGLLD